MNLEQVMMQLITTFDQNAGTDGDFDTLSTQELKKLVKSQFPMFCKHEKDDDVLKGLFGQMDHDGDKKVTFEEYGLFLVTLANILRDNMHKKKGCKK